MELEALGSSARHARAKGQAGVAIAFARFERSKRLHSRVEELFDRLARVEDLTGDDFYAVQPYAFYFMPEWDHPERELYRTGVVWWLIRQHVEGKLADSSHFFTYVKNPRSYSARLIPDRLLSERLDMLGAEQQDDGGWPTPYDAGWRGPETVQCLLFLQAFGRL